jgi:ABC-type dipeptide/oligopeptide/nickel transport system ATPase component
MTLLNVRDLKTYFFTGNSVVRAVDEIDLSINKGKTEGLVGESGCCGKSVTALSIMRLIPSPGRTVGGKIFFEGEDLLRKSPYEMAKIRGKKISIIFQEPLSSLNPVLRIRKQVEEVIRLHQGLDRLEAKEEAVKMMELVGIPSPSTRVRDYPHQLSGGMRQRVMIAQILNLMKDVQESLKLTYLFIAYDLSIVKFLCDRVAVMYLGKIVEMGQPGAYFMNPCTRTRKPFWQRLRSPIRISSPGDYPEWRRAKPCPTTTRLQVSHQVPLCHG